MQIETRKEPVKATKIFTDREKPRESFWKQYELVKAEPEDQAQVHVLAYYGVGGIGKTSLLKQLMLEMDQRVKEPRYVYYDLNLNQECRVVLEKLKIKLMERYKFSFPLFDLGLYCYTKKIGENPDSPEVKQITDKSPFLSLALDILGQIPVMSLATKVLSLADKGVALARTYLMNHRDELEDMQIMEAEELYDFLPTLFARDLAHNLEKTKEPLVILLDTYERLVNELSAGEPLENDWWLRGDSGVILRVPKVLWVIGGREKLKWERFDPEWKDALDQHILGNLSEADSDQFLKTAGVRPELLRQQLYDLTNGTPVYLDLCVTQYGRYREKGKTPEISLFGSNTYDLIQRFARYMDDGQKDMVHMLSCLQRWDDDLISRIGSKILPNFSNQTYETTKELSFVIQSDTGSYNIHQTVGEVLLAHAPQMLKNRAAEVITEHFEEELKTLTPLSKAFFPGVEYLVQAGQLCSPDAKAMHKFFEDHILQNYVALIKFGQYAQAERIIGMLTAGAGADKMGILHALSLREQAWLMFKKKQKPFDTFRLAAQSLILHIIHFGEDSPEVANALWMLGCATSELRDHDEEALALFRRAKETFERVYGVEHKDTILAMRDTEVSLYRLGRYEEALPVALRVLELRKKILSPEDPRTLEAMSDLSYLYHKLNMQDQVLPLRQEVYEKTLAALGAENPQTAAEGARLAFTLQEQGRYEEALQLRQQVLAMRETIFGPEHRDTVEAQLSVARVLHKMGRTEEAIPIWNEGLKKKDRIRKTKPKETLMDLVRGIRSIDILHNTKLEEAAQRLYLCRKTCAEDHPDIRCAEEELARQLHESKFDELAQSMGYDPVEPDFPMLQWMDPVE